MQSTRRGDDVLPLIATVVGTCLHFFIFLQAADTQAITSYVRHHIDSFRRGTPPSSSGTTHLHAAYLVVSSVTPPTRPPTRPPRSVESGTPGWINVKTAAQLVMQIAYSNKDKLQVRSYLTQIRIDAHTATQ